MKLSKENIKSVSSDVINQLIKNCLPSANEIGVSALIKYIKKVSE